MHIVRFSVFIFDYGLLKFLLSFMLYLFVVQEACMLQLSSLADTLRAVDSGWTNFNRVYEESCLTLDDKESQFEMVPCLSVTNFVKVNHFNIILCFYMKNFVKVYISII